MNNERPQAPLWYLAAWLAVALLLVGLAVSGSWVAWLSLPVCYPVIMKAVSWRPVPQDQRSHLDA